MKSFIFFAIFLSVSPIFGMASLLQKNINIFNVKKNISPQSLQQIRFITQTQKLQSNAISKIIFMRHFNKFTGHEKLSLAIQEIKNDFHTTSVRSNYNLKADYYIEMYKLYQIARQLGLFDFQFCKLADWQNSDLMTAKNFYLSKINGKIKIEIDHFQEHTKSSPLNNIQLSELQAFNAMKKFLEINNSRFSYTFDALLDNLEMMKTGDGKPAAPLAWDDWRNAVKEVLEKNN